MNDIVYYSEGNPDNCVVILENEQKVDFESLVIMLLVSSIPGMFFLMGSINILKIIKRFVDVRHLNQHGKLVKNLPYRLENSNVSVNDVNIKQLIICYFLPDGNTVLLRSDSKFDRKLADADGCVDLVIGENNPTKYFIDLEINRKGGNLPQDFCDQEKYKKFFKKNNNLVNLCSDDSSLVNQYNNPYDD